VRDPQLVRVDVRPRLQLRVELDHPAGEVQHDPGLPLVRGHDEDLGGGVADEELGHGKGGGQGRLSVGTRKTDQGGADPLGERAADDLPLPRAEAERLAGTLALRDDDVLADEALTTASSITRPAGEVQRLDLDPGLDPGLHC